MIRNASVKDLRRMHKLERICFKRGFQRVQIESLLLNPNAFSLVFEDKKKIIGSLILYTDGNGAKVLTIGVHPSFRRKGIGKKLMFEAEAIVKSLKLSNINLEVSTNNVPAINLYTSLGFQFDGVVENYYAWGDDAYCMSKKIRR